ncbi:DNA-binding response regulator [Caldovatus sediminis]|uniref:DNA-binding response regulator n=1 Tax=Caldovatus sediminis TaxID=2041189 RepID=A0A8J2ZCJ9_9PROT|nr:DNA-binding response regulator [Caldovatus sediminis]
MVDDDARLRALLQRFLAEQGFRVTAAADAAAARAALASFAFDLIVLDVMMPGESGLALTESLRRAGHDVPILMLTARGEPDDRIAGFEHGVDDYLPKPFDPRELALRIRTILRRAAPPAAATPAAPIQLGLLWFDPERAELRGPDGPVRLTGGEAALLAALARRAGEVLAREEIAAALGTPEAGERAIDVQVTRLRRKIEPDPREPRFLQTIRHRGYVLRPGP